MIKSFVAKLLIDNNIPIISCKDKYVLYTAAFGEGYNFQKFQNNKYKYKIFIFTDQKNLINNNFNGILVNSKIQKNLLNRVFKFLPHKIFPNVDTTIYFDAKKFPKESFNIENEKKLLNCDISIHKLKTSYKCIYKHYEHLTEKRILNNEDVYKNLILHYKKSSFPKNFGIGDTAIILKKKNIIYR